MASGSRPSSPALTWPMPSPGPRRTPRTCRRAAAACGNGCSADMPVILRPHIWRSPPDFDSISEVLQRLAAKAWELADAAEQEESAGSKPQRRYAALQDLAGQAQDALRLLQQY